MELFSHSRLILNDLPVWHWAVTGVLIALITVLLQYLTNHSLGISTSFENLCSFVSRAPYLHRSEISEEKGRWRIYFVLGLIAGGVLSAVLGGGWKPTWSLGIFDQRIGFGPFGKLLWMFIGGLFIGFGTRLAGGCTSGHGIFGLSNFERSSFASVISFMVAGIAFAHFVYFALFP